MERLTSHYHGYPFLLCLCPSELWREQGADPEGLFVSVLLDSEVGNVASGYCLQEGISTRRWVWQIIDCV